MISSMCMYLVASTSSLSADAPCLLVGVTMNQNAFCWWAILEPSIDRVWGQAPRQNTQKSRSPPAVGEMLQQDTHVKPHTVCWCADSRGEATPKGPSAFGGGLQDREGLGGQFLSGGARGGNPAGDQGGRPPEWRRPKRAGSVLLPPARHDVYQLAGDQRAAAGVARRLACT